MLRMEYSSLPPHGMTGAAPCTTHTSHGTLHSTTLVR